MDVQPYEKDRRWSDRFIGEVKDLVKKEILPHIVEVLESSTIEDTTLGFDLKVNIPGTIGVRLRRPGYVDYNDVTLRVMRTSGATTEVAKLSTGTCRWYFYGWTDGKSGVTSWVFFDLECVRRSDLLQRFSGTTKENKDHSTFFITIPLEALRLNGCIVVEKGTSGDYGDIV